MRHHNDFRKLGRTAAHRRALFANLAMALFENGRIKTTDAKAKDLRRVAEKLVTVAKEGTLDARRRVYAELGGSPRRHAADEPTRMEKVVSVLFGELAERFKDRPGGYTRIMKMGHRHGDSAPMALIELVGHETKKAE